LCVNSRTPAQVFSFTLSFDEHLALDKIAGKLYEWSNVCTPITQNILTNYFNMAKLMISLLLVLLVLGVVQDAYAQRTLDGT
jgi:hypothetical protein